MRRTRVVLSMLIAFVLVASLAGSAFAAPVPKAKWTVMVYISGDNNLEDYVVRDIETELAPTGSTANVQVVALADRGPGYDTSYGDWQGTKYFHVTRNMTADPANADAAWTAAYGDELNMADPQTLINFVSWTRTNYPADRYALVFWGHGWNWHPDYVMLDETVPGTAEPDTLDYEEEKAAISSLGFVDVVGYDGCNMASIEILNLWHGHATAVTGSQEYVGWEGLQYDLVLAQMAAANGNLTADQVAVAFSQSASADKTWSAIAVDARYDALFNAVDQWSDALLIGLAANRKKYDRAFGATRSFWQAPMDKDLYDMAYEINRQVSDPAIRTTGQAVMDAVTAVTLHERHVNAYSDVHGITIYHISRATEKDKIYGYYIKNVDFAGWGAFLDAYAK